mgnify:CR=1 FL=1
MTTQNSRMRESTSLLCPICGKKQRTKGWLLWHLDKYHPDYVYVDNSPARTRGVEEWAEGRKAREDAIANRGAVVWECIGCGKLAYDVGVTAETPGLEVRKTTYCLNCLRGW